MVFRCGACGKSHSIQGEGWEDCARRVAREWGMKKEAPVPEAEIAAFPIPDPVAAAMNAAILEEAAEKIYEVRSSAVTLVLSWPAVLSLEEPTTALTRIWDRWWEEGVRSWLSMTAKTLDRCWHAEMPGVAPQEVEVSTRHPVWKALFPGPIMLKPFGPVLMGRRACAYQGQDRANFDWRVEFAVLQVHFYAGFRVSVRVYKNVAERGLGRDAAWALAAVDGCRGE